MIPVGVVAQLAVPCASAVAVTGTTPGYSPVTTVIAHRLFLAVVPCALSFVHT